MNPNNQNQGGSGKSAIREIVTEPVIVSSADLHPEVRKIGNEGSDFLSGSPAGREARPSPRRSGGDPTLT